MRVFEINSVCNRGSTGRIACNIANLVKANGGEVLVAYGRGKTDYQDSYKIGGILSVLSHVGLTRLFDLQCYGSYFATKKLVKKIDNFRPDVVHLHSIHGYYLNDKILFDYLKKKGIPTVWTLHDCWAFTGHCSHFVAVGCEKWKSFCSHCPQKRGYPTSLFLDNSRANFQRKRMNYEGLKNLHIVAVSKWLEGLLKESFLRGKDIRTIYNGIDTDTFCYRPSSIRSFLGLENKKVLLAAATSWVQRKGINDYIELSKRLPEDYKIVLVGMTSSQIKAMPKQILALGRTNNVIELSEYYSMADIVLNLSYAETFGLTTVEGMACGTPGIVYNATASPELITEKTGIVVPPGNIDKLVEAIKTICGKGKKAYMENCRNRAKCFDMNDRFQEYVDLFEEVIEKTR